MSQESIQQAHWIVQGALTTANGAPTAVTDGVAVPATRKGKKSTLRYSATTSSGAWTVDGRIWAYSGGAVTTAGAASLANAGWFDTYETFTKSGSADIKSTVDDYDGLTKDDRLFVEVTAYTGTDFSFTPIWGFTE